jgi:hypothetical protein
MTPRNTALTIRPRLALLAVVLLSSIGAASAADVSAGPTPVVGLVVNESEIVCTPQPGVSRLVLTVSGPGEIWFRRVVEGGSPLVIDVVDAEGRPLPDGQYTYELRQDPMVDPDTREALVAARESGEEAATVERLRSTGKLPQQTTLQSGGFSIRDGAFVTGGLPETEAPQRSAATRAGRGSLRHLEPGKAGDVDGNATRDQVILDDLIVDGSLCTGNDCANGEAFGFDTIRLKENNLRIKFDDTSTIQNYPRNDWQITANESTDGGLNKFSIDDIDGGRTPFTIEAGARTNSLYVNRSGRIGIGTATPNTHLHAVHGDTPTLRLQQDGSGGWTAQTWDVGGNETNFFIRDITHASRLPFRIEPGAPNSSLSILDTGDISFVGNLGLADEATVDGRDVSADGALLDSLSDSARMVGIIPASAFDMPSRAEAAWAWLAWEMFGTPLPPSRPATADVTLATPYEQGQSYVVTLTAVSSNGSTDCSPVVMTGRDHIGFTVSLGEHTGPPTSDPRRAITEVHWTTQLVP